MSSIRTMIDTDHGSTRRVPPGPSVVLGVLSVACGIWLVVLLVSGRGTPQTPLDCWPADAIEVAAGLFCAARATRSDTNPLIALALGAGLLSWAGGDIVTSIDSVGRSVPADPSSADIFYLGFYPLAYAGIVLFLRREVGRLTAPDWMDGTIVGLGAAAASAAFVLRDLGRADGTTGLATVTNLAYPVGDLLLLAVTVGGTAIIARDRRRSWGLLVAAMIVNALGDSTGLLRGAAHLTGGAKVLDGMAWPVSSVIVAAAVWLRPRATAAARAPEPSLVLPNLAALAGLAVLFVGAFRHGNRIALGLAAATLAAVAIRRTRSVHLLRDLSRERQRQSVTDELTGLANRRYLSEMIDAWFARHRDDPPGRGAGLAFLFLDLDSFKEVNDSFGHHAGDDLLRQLGPRLSAVLRASDVVARLGGDEFAVVLRHADVAYAESVARRLGDAVRVPFGLGAVRARVGVSIGIAIAPTDACDADSLMARADAAMYRAKAAKLAWAVYDPSLDGDEVRIRSAEELVTALDEGQLVVHYQPQVALGAGRVLGVEALVRWDHPTLGRLAPEQFLPLAEEAGLMPRVTRLVLAKATAQWERWHRAGLDLSMSVNISAGDLVAGLVEDVRHGLHQHGLPAGALILEVTETTVITEFDRARAVIADIDALGAVVSIDDFGAGFTSLAHLGRLRVGELKLDRSFMGGLGVDGDARDAEVVRATIQLAHALHLRVVAEGVEDSHTLQRLVDFDCDVAQGYLLSRALPPDELAAWVRAGGARRDRYVGA